MSEWWVRVCLFSVRCQFVTGVSVLLKTRSSKLSKKVRFDAAHTRVARGALFATDSIDTIA